MAKTSKKTLKSKKKKNLTPKEFVELSCMCDN